MTGSAYLTHLKRRWWLVALEALIAVAVVTGVSARQAKTSYTYTAHFVMHPARDTPTGEVANLAQQLDPSGPVVQTVLRVLSTPEMLARAEREAKVPPNDRVSLSASVSPGSNFFDATVEGATGALVMQVGNGLEAAAPQYVAASYHGYNFDILGHDTGTQDGFPPRTDVLLLALVVGAAAAPAEVFLELSWSERRARRRSLAAAAVASDVDAGELYEGDDDEHDEHDEHDGHDGHEPEHQKPPVVVRGQDATDERDGKWARANGNGNGSGNKTGSVPAKGGGNRRARMLPSRGVTRE